MLVSFSKVYVTVDKPTQYDIELDNELQKTMLTLVFYHTVVVPYASDVVVSYKTVIDSNISSYAHSVPAYCLSGGGIAWYYP